MRRSFFGRVVYQGPNAVLNRELIVLVPDLRPLPLGPGSIVRVRIRTRVISRARNKRIQTRRRMVGSGSDKRGFGLIYFVGVPGSPFFSDGVGVGVGVDQVLSCARL